MKTKMTKIFYSRLVAKILLQAAKDYINPSELARTEIKGIDKNAPDYDEQVLAVFSRHREQILKSLRSSHMDLLTDGKSLTIARKLQEANLSTLKKKMKEEERRIEYEESLERHKYDHKVESVV